MSVPLAVTLWLKKWEINTIYNIYAKSKKSIIDKPIICLKILKIIIPSTNPISKEKSEPSNGKINNSKTSYSQKTKDSRKKYQIFDPTRILNITLLVSNNTKNNKNSNIITKKQVQLLLPVEKAILCTISIAKEDKKK